jgi:surfeit locus 1 family protein
MTRGSMLVAIAAILVAAVCTRLGFWQVSRYHEKHRQNLAMRAALSAPPLSGAPRLPSLAEAQGRRVRVRGHYDETRQFLIGGRSHDTSPGVEVVTPLIPDGGGPAVLVNRGWLYAADAATALPQRTPDPGTHDVVGLAQPFETAPGWGAMHRVPADSVELWSARALERDSVTARLPYAIAPFLLRALPAPDAPKSPLRSLPAERNEMMHVSYAVQWFLFAAIALIGPLVLSWSRRRAAPRDPDAANPDLSFQPPRS